MPDRRLFLLYRFVAEVSRAIWIFHLEYFYCKCSLYAAVSILQNKREKVMGSGERSENNVWSNSGPIVKLQRNTLDDRLLQMVLEFAGAGNAKGWYEEQTFASNKLPQELQSWKQHFVLNRIGYYMKMQNLKCFLGIKIILQKDDSRTSVT